MFTKSVRELLVSPLTFIIDNLYKNKQLSRCSENCENQCNTKISQPMELRDYRPVSIFPVLSKVYEKLVLK